VTQRLEVTLLTLFVLSLTACNSGGNPHSTPSGTGSKKTVTSVHSSLDGLSVLPSHIRWTATTSVPTTDVREVRFIVDHDRWWVDRTPPYSYGPDGGDLPTRFISSLGKPGELHSFKVKVITTSGERWSETVHARTPDAHVVRRGEYVRLSAVALARPPPLEKFPDRGFLHLIGAGLFVKDVKRSRDFAWELSGDVQRVQLGTPIFLAQGSDADNGSGFDELEDILCGSGGPPATYRWSKEKGPLLPSMGTEATSSCGQWTSPVTSAVSLSRARGLSLCRVDAGTA
jgi:hypothetical protein